MTLIQSSDDAERFWLMVHADQGPHLVGVWYRPPAPGETGTVSTFKAEYSALENMSLGSIILGDLNAHNRQWLKHSSHNSTEGRALQDACDDIGLRQIVTKPTREDHLLDLVLTNIPGVRTKVLPSIADHKLVVAELPFKVPEQAVISRTVWRYAKADWVRMRSELKESDWNCMIAMDPDTASIYLANRISDVAELCVPKKQVREKKSTHPWLTNEVEDLVEAKRAAEGTPNEREAAEACSAGTLKQYMEFTKDSARKLSEIPAGSKGWWSKTRRLMDNKPAVSSVPALKSSGGEWIFEPTKKATAFAKTFSDKYSLAPKEENEYSAIHVSEDQLTCGPLPAEEDAAKTLGALKVDSATGPDLLPVRILRECAAQLAKPFRLLAILILQYQIWPRPWMVHWIVPLYKKGASFVPGNYRGIHLTPQISKAMERFIGSMFTTITSTPACVGPNQFAYQKARGARDALAFMVLTWISGFNAKLKFALYCSDVSGAFDRVKRERLIAKLQAKGMPEVLVGLFDAWLQDREARVVVGGQRSDPMILRDMIYQGTVWGPWLWNIFYEDARLALQVASFLEVVFADDLNAFRPFPLKTPNEAVIRTAEECQQELHKWGRANQVQFDPGKESLHVISHHCPAGRTLRFWA